MTLREVLGDEGLLVYQQLDDLLDRSDRSSCSSWEVVRKAIPWDRSVTQSARAADGEIERSVPGVIRDR